MNEDEYITVPECDRKHKSTRGLMVLMIAIVSLSAIMNTNAWYSAQDASFQSAIQGRDIIHLNTSIAELKEEIKLLRNTLDRMGTTGKIGSTQ